MTKNFRFEKDSMGQIKVPSEALWGAQTQRSIINFSIGEELIPIELIYSLTVIKRAAAISNFKLGLINNVKKDLIIEACTEILDGKHDSQFPLKIWQTGSGTQTNMNINEVISNIAALKTNSELGSHHPIHPNDDVNKSQSTNDTFPAAIQISVVTQIIKKLVPSIKELTKVLDSKSNKWKDLIKIGRTHFQDAVPISLGQEVSAWSKQLKDAEDALIISLDELCFLPLGGTAVGTGINCPKDFSKESIKSISEYTGLFFYKSKNHFSLMASHDRLAQVMGQIKILASALFKISNDIKILSSGPRSGIYELIIPQNEPGSSIMPGKVNPTQCEALSMVCTQVMGFEYAVSIANASGTLQMNEYKPLIGFNILTSIKLLNHAISNFRLKLVEGIQPNPKTIKANLENSLMLVTALVPKIGYEKAAEIANLAFNESINLKEATIKLGYLTANDFEDAINTNKMI
ncbi:MAG: class II fumarate hydratase [Prochlorococcus marinus subsp. pastoris]|jgi:fumarate hydratase class II|uniref:class II fumarate hydratase n=1 Tax=uncultured Prochlorococcus sp. TaxID=159733 RepID=UPI0025901DAA|nr:class II fumarate hydratase [uncultured Prochlorococcus sp.]|tara:strand:- start:2754 stop:4139 length:1386 start_codon:yes stop_codon:yes gene_type:complete